MLDSIAQAQADRATLGAFLFAIQRGRLSRRGYVKFTLQWLGRPASAEVKAAAKAAEAAGLITWGCTTGPNVVATLTDAGREALK